MDTQTQIDRLIELAIVQRAELKKLVSELPQLREHLNAEIERVFESTEPQLRTELEDWTTKQAHDQTVKLGGELEAKIVALSKSLEATTQTRYNAIMAERAQNIDLAKKAEDKLAEVAQAIPVQVKQIVTDELARFPRAGEIDQLRKEFAEPRGLNPRGRWEPGATYYKLDLVAYNGDSYVANEETSEKPNRTSSKWTLNAARGQAGGGGFMSPAIGDYTASMITNVPAGVITSTNVQDAINELAADVDVSQNTLDALVTNADSVTITKGQVVYAFGSVGNRMSVKLALNTGDTTSSKTIGVVLDSSIAAGAIGNIRCVGVVDGLTLGSYTEGDVLYLGATAGSVTATKPYAPNHLVYVGIVERANNGNGELYVKIQNGYELNEIHDVQITSAPLAGALLMRDATNSLWKANRLTGTTNQVTVTNADTAVTLSLPTSLASVDSITASASTALTLTGGSSGASLVLGQGANGAVTATPAGTGIFTVKRGLAASATGTAFFIQTTDPTSFGLIFELEGNATSANRFATISSYMNGDTGRALVLNRYGGNVLIGTSTDMTGSGGLKVAGTTAATTTTSGALIVAGGVGVGGAGYFGGQLSANSGNLFTNTVATNNNYVTLSTDTTARDAAYISKNGTADWYSGLLGSLASDSAWRLYHFQTSSTRLSVTTAGVVNIPNTTSASSSIIGALTIGNGTAATNVAIGGGNVNAGGIATFGTNATGGIMYLGGLAPNADTGSQINLFTSNATYNWRIATNTTASGILEIAPSTVAGGTTMSGRVFTLTKDGLLTLNNPAGGLSVSGTTEATTSVGVGALTTGGGIHAAKRIVSDSTEASTGSTSGSGIFAGGIYAGAASVFGSTVNSLGFLLNRTNNSGVYTGTSDNYGFTWTGTNGEMSTATGSMIFKPAATTALTLTSTAATFANAVVTASATLSGAGAIPITTSLVKFTSTGAAQALTLANGVDGQRLTIVHDVKGTLGTGVLTPTTKTGFSTVTFANAGDTVSLVYVATRGWMVTGSYLATIAP